MAYILARHFIRRKVMLGGFFPIQLWPFRLALRSLLQNGKWFGGDAAAIPFKTG